MDKYSLADIKSVTEGGNDNFLWWVLILFFLSGNGGFGFGGNRAVDQVTNEFLFNNLANQNRELMGSINTVDRDILNTSCATNKEIVESRYTTQLGFQNLGSQMATCCCNIEQAIHKEGEETRALITQNAIQDLRDRLQLANNAITNQTLANEIVNKVRPFPQPAYITCSPYQSQYYGCGCNNI